MIELITSGPSGLNTMVRPALSKMDNGPPLLPAQPGPVAAGWCGGDGGGVTGLGNAPVMTLPDMQPANPRLQRGGAVDGSGLLKLGQ